MFDPMKEKERDEPLISVAAWETFENLTKR
jgi:hypothetical protein